MPVRRGKSRFPHRTGDDHDRSIRIAGPGAGPGSRHASGGRATGGAPGHGGHLAPGTAASALTFWAWNPTAPLSKTRSEDLGPSPARTSHLAAFPVPVGPLGRIPPSARSPTGTAAGCCSRRSASTASPRCSWSACPAGPSGCCRGGASYRGWPARPSRSASRSSTPGTRADRRGSATRVSGAGMRTAGSAVAAVAARPDRASAPGPHTTTNLRPRPGPAPAPPTAHPP